MNFQDFVWNKVRTLNRLPFAYSLFYLITNLIYRDGSVLSIRRGPAAGFRWYHFRGYQPWMAFGLYEPDTAFFISQHLRPGDVFYDIGANAGYFTLVGAKAVGKKGHVIAFDPLPLHVETIKKQIAANKLTDNCRVEAVAVADFEGITQFSVPARKANAHLTDVEAPHISPETKGMLLEVPCTTLDRYIQISDTRPNLIKIDIEGAELKALGGARQLLSNPQAPIWVITAHAESIAQEVRKILTNHQYSFQENGNTFYAFPHS